MASWDFCDVADPPRPQLWLDGCVNRFRALISNNEKVVAHEKECRNVARCFNESHRDSEVL